MPHKPDQELIVSQEAEEAFAARIGPTDPAGAALSTRLLEIKQLQLHGDPAFQPGSRFFGTKTGKFVESITSKITTFLDPTAGGGAGGVLQGGGGAGDVPGGGAP